MRLNLQPELAPRITWRGRNAYVEGEADRLTDVALSIPSYLSAVPCCSVTRENLTNGFEVNVDRALEQHRALAAVLAGVGVRCHFIEPGPHAPDMCFVRDVCVGTPWGLMVLRPALPHRAIEGDLLLDFARDWGSTRKINEGAIEGGDVCIARPGLLIIGISGERTNRAGANAFAEPFVEAGWTVVTCPLDPHFLHLDTVFCMLDGSTALACIDVLDDGFLAEMARQGIELLPVTYKESRKLACNVLSLGHRRIVASTVAPRVSASMRAAGFAVTELDISELSACGGGIHCLTLPLKREPARDLRLQVAG